MKIIRPYLKSFTIYFVSEIVISQHSEPSPEESGKRIILGVAIDVILMRRFHKFVDKRRLNNIQKVGLEQIALAPTIGTLFLAAHNKFSLDNLTSMVLDDCKFWIPTSLIGYRLVSTEKRFLYTGIASVVWNNIRVLTYA